MNSQTSTKDLNNELMSRPGVESIIIEPYEEAKIMTESTERIIQGPAIILINQD